MAEQLCKHSRIQWDEMKITGNSKDFSSTQNNNTTIKQKLFPFCHFGFSVFHRFLRFSFFFIILNRQHTISSNV